MTDDTRQSPKVSLLRPEAASRVLTAAEFRGLAEVPAEIEWFANITNANTRRAYQNDVREFMGFAGILEPQEFRIVARSHLIAWRKLLASRNLAAATIRRKLSAMASLFDHLCESNAVAYNPCDGVKRPNLGSNEGKSPALGDDQAKLLYDGVRRRGQSLKTSTSTTICWFFFVGGALSGRSWLGGWRQVGRRCSGALPWAGGNRRPTSPVGMRSGDAGSAS